MKIKHDIERTKMLRIKANEGRKGMSIFAERSRESVETGRSLYWVTNFDEWLLSIYQYDIWDISIQTII